ncbi:MAG: YibE/F family protein [Anaerostipes sp.]|jgi:uncharacterized membrane protein
MHYNNPNAFDTSGYKNKTQYTEGKTAAGTDYYYTYGKTVSWKKIVILAIAVCLFAGIIFKCNQFQKTPLASYKGQKYEKAVVTKIIKDNLAEDGSRYGTQKVLVKMTTGTYKGKEKEAINPSGTLFGADCKVGTRIIVIVNKSGSNAGFTVYSQDRTMAIYGFALIFAAVVCAIGGKKGVYAILSLVFAFACIIGIMFPMMYQGISPILLTILVAVLTTIVTLGLLGGYSTKTAAAILGTAAGVVIAAIAAIVFGKAAGIIISALGAVMDVGMSIASTIQEIYETDKTLSMKRLFISGINVGRDMMGTMTNTLIFAYVGGAMSTLVINYAYDLSYHQLANSYVIGIEIMQGLSGSIGVVLTVPITAVIASFFG